MVQSTLRISEIFYSLQGEAVTVGKPTVFIRLTGCPLRCQYCDSAYAFSGGRLMSVEEILDEISVYQPKYITVTGGEPLAQQNVFVLLDRLVEQGVDVSIETSGAFDVTPINESVNVVMDIKTPASLEVDKNYWENLNHLKDSDQVKFVICDRNDYEWAKDVVAQYGLARLQEVLFSPEHEALDASLLAQWILDDRLPVRFQLQMHKYIWGNVPGR